MMERISRFTAYAVHFAPRIPQSRGDVKRQKSKKRGRLLPSAVGLLIFPPPTIHNPTEEPFQFIGTAAVGVHIPAEGVRDVQVLQGDAILPQALPFPGDRLLR